MVPKHDIKGYSLMNLLQIKELRQILRRKMQLLLQNASKTGSKRGGGVEPEGRRLNLKGS